MKKIILTMLVLGMCLLSVSCEDKEAPAGEVVTQQEAEVKVTEEKEPEKAEEIAVEETKDKAVLLIESLSATESNGGEYLAHAESFAKAIMDADTLKVAEYTGGNADYYNFLEDVTIDGYRIYPFEMADVFGDTYFVSFDVAKGDGEFFVDGECVYLMHFEENPLSGNLLKTFALSQKSAELLTDTVAEDENQAYTEAFIREFTTLYAPELADGRNYPDYFDFADDAHLITHLMAVCGRYQENPPYTLGEINDYIECAFEGAKTMGEHEIDYNEWLYTTDFMPEDRVYGCSFYHGLATAEYCISDVRTDGSSKVYTVDVYADYSKFAKAYTLIYYFDFVEDNVPRLTMVELDENTGLDAAVNSI